MLLSLHTSGPVSAASRASSAAIALWVSLPCLRILIRSCQGVCDRKLFLAGLMLLLTSCGGGGVSGGGGAANPGTPAGNYLITVTATSGSLNHSVQAALTLQ